MIQVTLQLRGFFFPPHGNNYIYLEKMTRVANTFKVILGNNKVIFGSVLNPEDGQRENREGIS